MGEVQELPVRNQFQHKALELLASGFAQDFADYLSSDEQVLELIMEKVGTFINENIPFTDEEAEYDLAHLLMDKVYFKADC